ncbi:MAG TPA: sigma-70 family RNA polymerase sigma factor [Anaeromyxobacter sp.]
MYQIPIDRDGVALALLAAGDRRGAAAELLRVHGPRIREYLRALLRDEDAADDAFSLFSEWTLGAIWRYRGDSALRTWAFGVAFNAARRVRSDAYRRRRRPLRRRDISELPERRSASSAARRERAARRLDELRRHLSEEDQNLLALRVEQRLEWGEIVGVLASGGQEVSAPALRKRFERLKDRIGRLARELGVFE